MAKLLLVLQGYVLKIQPLRYCMPLFAHLAAAPMIRPFPMLEAFMIPLIR